MFWFGFLSYVYNVLNTFIICYHKRYFASFLKLFGRYKLYCFFLFVFVLFCFLFCFVLFFCMLGILITFDAECFLKGLLLNFRKTFSKGIFKKLFQNIYVDVVSMTSICATVTIQFLMTIYLCSGWLF